MSTFNKLLLIKKWTQYFNTNTSIYVRHKKGTCYSRDEIKGYYIDTTEIFKSSAINYNNDALPTSINNKNESVLFPIRIAYYGLANYDNYLKHCDVKYLEIAKQAADWLANHMNDEGGVDTFNAIGTRKINPCSCITQSCMISLYIRIYNETSNVNYIEYAKKAYQLMLTEVENLGLARYLQDNICFEEVVEENTSLILNGWVLGIFGIFDYYKHTRENADYYILNKSIDSLINFLSKYDCGYWSCYDLLGNIASPHYHRLHIVMLEVLFDLFGRNEFNAYKLKWGRYYSNKFYYGRAILYKVYQRLFVNKIDSFLSN